MTDPQLDACRRHRTEQQLSSALSALVQMAIAVRIADTLGGARAEVDRIQGGHEARFTELDRAYASTVKALVVGGEPQAPDLKAALPPSRRLRVPLPEPSIAFEEAARLPTKALDQLLSGVPSTPTIEDEEPPFIGDEK